MRQLHRGLDCLVENGDFVVLLERLGDLIRAIRTEPSGSST